MTRALSTATPASSARRGGEGLVGLGEAARMPPFDGAQKADYLVADDDRHVHHGALAARDHLGPLLGGELEIVVVRRGDAALGGGSGARADVAQSVDRRRGLAGCVVGGLVVSDDLDRARRLLADEDVAVLDLEALGEAPRDVDQRAFGRPPPGAAAVALRGVVVGRRLGGRPVPGEGLRVGRRLGDDGADALRQHELGRRVAPLPVAGEQLDHADALAAQHERQRQPAALDLGRRAARPRRDRAGRGRAWRTAASRLPITRAAVASEARAREPRTAVRTPLKS